MYLTKKLKDPLKATIFEELLLENMAQNDLQKKAQKNHPISLAIDDSLFMEACQELINKNQIFLIGKKYYSKNNPETPKFKNGHLCNRVSIYSLKPKQQRNKPKTP